MFETDRLIIRLMEEKDIEEVRQIHNDESTLKRLSDPFHVSKEEQLVWFRKISTSRNSRRFVLVLKESGELCGIFRIDDLDLANRSATIGADIKLTFRNQGYATEAYRKIIDYLFLSVGLHRLQLLTLESNEKALKLYLKLGFSIEGKYREAIFRDGDFVNLVLMGLLNKEWVKKPSI